MISLNITGKCAGCPAIDPIIATNRLEARDKKLVVALPSVACKNAVLCWHLERYIEDRLQEDRRQKELEEGGDE